jgi:hypothetical protein
VGLTHLCKDATGSSIFFLKKNRVMLFVVGPSGKKNVTSTHVFQFFFKKKKLKIKKKKKRKDPLSALSDQTTWDIPCYQAECVMRVAMGWVALLTLNIIHIFLLLLLIFLTNIRFSAIFHMKNKCSLHMHYI